MDEEIKKQIITGILKKAKASYSLDSNVLSEFDTICTSKGYKKSQVVENLLKMFIEQEKSLFGTNSINK
jgi:metal-responsive CopG/Arc/MetJ family transcriptional regulator